ncbi:MAG: phage tail protein [Fusobacteriaceae bacterium]|nr:phage tail protein [Fusobacteriaceae bacterium]
MLGSYGAIPFEASSSRILTINEMDVSESARWQKHEVNNVRPRSEFIGDEGQEINLKIGLKAVLGVNPRAILKAFQNIKRNGGVEPLVLGTEILGNFYIENIGAQYKQIDNRGNIWDIMMSLKLSEYCTETLEDVKKTQNTYKTKSKGTLNYKTGQVE